MQRGILSYRLNRKTRKQLQSYVSNTLDTLEMDNGAEKVIASMASLLRWIREQRDLLESDDG